MAVRPGLAERRLLPRLERKHGPATLCEFLRRIQGSRDELTTFSSTLLYLRGWTGAILALFSRFVGVIKTYLTGKYEALIIREVNFVTRFEQREWARYMKINCVKSSRSKNGSYSAR
jgi:hypothetical protein